MIQYLVLHFFNHRIPRLLDNLYTTSSSFRRLPAVISRCWRLLPLLFLVLLCLSLFLEPARVQAEYSEKDRPTIVTVYLGIIDIPQVDELMETFDVIAYLTLEWNDPLAYESVRDNHGLDDDDTYQSMSTKQAQEALEEIGGSNIIEFANLVGQREILNSTLQIESNGNVMYDERFAATFHSPLELKKFPFDSQKLYIRIESFCFDVTDIEFETSDDNIVYYRPPNVSGEEQGLRLEEWHIVLEKPTYKVDQYTSPLSGKTYSYISIGIDIQRKIEFYIWKIIFPLLLIICISWSVFWIGRESVSSRLSVASIGFLTAIAFGFFVSNNLPRIAYLTFMDMFIIGIYILVTMTVLEILGTYLLEIRGKEVSAVRLNYHSRWLFPLIFILYLLAVIWRFWS